MHLFTILVEHESEPARLSVASSLAAAIEASGLDDYTRAHLTRNWLPPTEGRDEWISDAPEAYATFRKIQLVSDGDDAFDSGVLELAAVILRKRVGLAIVGPEVRFLTKSARKIRGEK